MPHLRIIDSIRMNNGAATPVIKDYLSAGEDELRKRHASGESGARICKSYTGLVDNLLTALFTFKSEELKCQGDTALIAVGGYGRGELNIRSDIDLMLLYKKRITPEIENLTNQVLYSLWDTGLDLGFSIRSVAECITLARDDLKTMTAFLDLRFILGDRELFDSFSSRIRKDLFNGRRSAVFIKDKIEESRARHAKYGGSVYILEPNVKEGEGGLRDIHTAKWIVKAGSGKQVEPFSIGLISEQDKKAIEDSLDFLLWVRNELHFATNRKTDQLSFDHQERIAGMLGFVNTAHALGVESFMQHYYRHASNINRYSNLILSRCLHRDEKKSFFWPKKRVRVDKHYSIVNNLLTVRDRDAFKNDPSAVIKAFEYSQAFDVEIGQAAKDLILSFVEESDGGFREVRDVSDSFLKILKGRNVFNTLKEMHRLRFLDKYIPEFEEISCKVQHDLYHIYTVDAHTLFAVREIERLGGEYKSEFSLLSTIFAELPNPEILILAVLFHDIGKAHGKGHSEKGAEIVPRIGKRLNLSE
ncbi:MAG: HD domain-containing protein, partial [Deltaproteobacteria bacterium]